MSSRSKYRAYAYRAATIAAAYLVSLITWLDNRMVINLTGRVVGRWNSVGAWIGTTCIVVTFPGWFIVMMVSENQLATKLTDILIPILSGLFWGLLIIVVA